MSKCVVTIVTLSVRAVEKTMKNELKAVQLGLGKLTKLGREHRRERHKTIYLITKCMISRWNATTWPPFRRLPL